MFKDKQLKRNIFFSMIGDCVIIMVFGIMFEILIFIIRILCHIEHRWTFKSFPKEFKKRFFIHGHVYGKYCFLCYMLLNSKNEVFFKNTFNMSMKKINY